MALAPLDLSNRVPDMISLARQLGKPCHVCGLVHEERAVMKYCSYCLKARSGNFNYRFKKGKPFRYPIWHYDESGRRICHNCYCRLLRRLKAAGRSIRKTIKTEIQEAFPCKPTKVKSKVETMQPIQAAAYITV